MTRSTRALGAFHPPRRGPAAGGAAVLIGHWELPLRAARTFRLSQRERIVGLREHDGRDGVVISGTR